MHRKMVNIPYTPKDPAKRHNSTSKHNGTTKDLNPPAAMNNLSKGLNASTPNDLSNGCPDPLPPNLREGCDNPNIAPSLHLSSSGGRNEPVESDDRGPESVADNTAVPEPSCRLSRTLESDDRDSESVKGNTTVESDDRDSESVKGNITFHLSGTAESNDRDPESVTDNTAMPRLSFNLAGTAESCPGATASSPDSVVCLRIVPDSVSSSDNQQRHLQAETLGVLDDEELGAVGGVDDENTPEPYQPPDPLSNYSQFFDYNANILCASARTFLSNHLNQFIEGVSEEGYTKDWKGLAECMGIDVPFTYSLERQRDPTDEVFRQWITEQEHTIGQLLMCLKSMERYDILEDYKFFNAISRSVHMEKERQEKDKRELEEEEKRKKSSKQPEQQILTAADVEKGEIARYDAFVCFEEEDSDFVMEMLEQLEEKEGFTFCLSARDLLAGNDEQVVTAEMVKNRCRRTIVILSPAFLRDDSVMGQFAMRVAQSLNPARHNRIIPLTNVPCQVPPSLNHLTPVDFTRCHMRGWMWRKVIVSLKSDDQLIDEARGEVRKQLAQEVQQQLDQEDKKLAEITLDVRPPTFDLRASMREKRKKEASECVTLKVIPESSCEPPSSGKKDKKKSKVALRIKSTLSSMKKKGKKKKKKEKVTGEHTAIEESPSLSKDQQKEKEKKKKEEVTGEHTVTEESPPLPKNQRKEKKKKKKEEMVGEPDEESQSLSKDQQKEESKTKTEVTEEHTSSEEPPSLSKDQQEEKKKTQTEEVTGGLDAATEEPPSLSKNQQEEKKKKKINIIKKYFSRRKQKSDSKKDGDSDGDDRKPVNCPSPAT